MEIAGDTVPKATDPLLEAIADYVCDGPAPSAEAWQTARLCLADALGCAILALQYPACSKLLGPIVLGTTVPYATPLPGTYYQLDPVRAAFNLGTMIRWLDYNDTWLAAEWGHPSDNIGGLLPLLDHLSRKFRHEGHPCFTGSDLLLAMIRAYEIQGILALANSFNRVGYDHVILVRIATAAVATGLLGGNKQQVIDAVSQAWIDAAPLRCYRHAPNVGSRKSWAAGDATSRGIQLALWTMQGEKGYSQPLTTPQWGFCDVVLHGAPLLLARPFEDYVMQNVLFKVAFPAEFHAQTAVEAAVRLHRTVRGRLEQIETIEIDTHESAIRIIDKKGILHNPADRDHCLQYMVAIGLLHGTLNANHYENEAAADPRIDLLRAKMVIREQAEYSRDYLADDKRSIANAITIRFNDGTSSDTIAIEYPLGHRRRRREAVPLLFDKFQRNLLTTFSPGRTKKLVTLFEDQERLEEIVIPTLLDFFSPEQSD
jgi:2-methylcitrate dehydratase